MIGSICCCFCPLNYYENTYEVKQYKKKEHIWILQHPSKPTSFLHVNPSFVEIFTSTETVTQLEGEFTENIEYHQYNDKFSGWSSVGSYRNLDYYVLREYFYAGLFGVPNKTIHGISYTDLNTSYDDLYRTYLSYGYTIIEFYEYKTNTSRFLIDSNFLYTKLLGDI